MINQLKGLTWWVEDSRDIAMKNILILLFLLVPTLYCGQTYPLSTDSLMVQQVYSTKAGEFDSTEYSTRNPINTGSVPHLIYDTLIFYKTTENLKIIYIKKD